MGAVELKLLNGVVLRVLPLTVSLSTRLRLMEMDKDPFDESPYLTTVKNIEGETQRVDKTSTEYRDAFTLYNVKITTRANAKVFEHLVQAIEPDKQTLLQDNADDITSYRALLGDDRMTDWQLLIDNLLVTSAEDRKALNQALSSSLPITDEEVATALTTFRYEVRRVQPDDTERTAKRAKKSQSAGS